MKFSKLLAGTALGLFSTLTNATTVFTPTDGDINFVLETGALSGYTLAIFDEAADFGGGLYLEVTAPELIYWDSNINQLHDATSTDILTIDGDFVLAVSGDGGTTWIGGDYDPGSIFTVPEVNTYGVKFSGVQGLELVVDVTPVPVPAAVWLFGTGLIGMVAVARRKA